MLKYERSEYMHNYHQKNRIHRLELFRKEYKARTKTLEGRKQCNDRAKAWREIHPEYFIKYRQTEKFKNASKKRYWDQRKKLIELLGGKCVSCGITDIRILQINHKNHNGNKERQTWKDIGRFYRAILSGKRMKNDLEIRCANCNIIYEYESGKRKIYE